MPQTLPLHHPGVDGLMSSHLLREANDAPKTLSYANASVCSIGADIGHAGDEFGRQQAIPHRFSTDSIFFQRTE